MSKVTWKMNVEISVDTVWVADGFAPDKEEFQLMIVNMIERRLGEAYPSEIAVKVSGLRSPKKKRILELQGYDWSPIEKD